MRREDELNAITSLEALLRKIVAKANLSMSYASRAGRSDWHRRLLILRNDADGLLYNVVEARKSCLSSEKREACK